MSHLREIRNIILCLFIVAVSLDKEWFFDWGRIKKMKTDYYFKILKFT